MSDIIINTKTLTTSPLTWDRYAKMIETAINQGIKDFLFTNDDIAYRFYAESRFRKIVKLSHIDLQNFPDSKAYIENILKIHYLVNPEFPDRIETFYGKIGLKHIETIYVQYSSNVETFEELLDLVCDYKDHGKCHKIGLVYSDEDDLARCEEIISNRKIDSVISKTNQLNFENHLSSENLEVNYELRLYQDIFLLINLLFLQKNTLKSKMSLNQELMSNLASFIENYNIEKEFKAINNQHIVINADNDSLLACMLSSRGDGNEIALLDRLSEQIENVKRECRESWWTI